MKRTIIAGGAMLALALQASATSEPGGSSVAVDKKAVATTAADTSSTQSKVQTVCPVMGGTVDRSVLAIWNGDKTHGPKKVYFCCAGCIDPFNKEPLKYIKKLEKMKQPVEDVAVKQK